MFSKMLDVTAKSLIVGCSLRLFDRPFKFEDVFVNSLILKSHLDCNINQKSALSFLNVGLVNVGLVEMSIGIWRCVEWFLDFTCASIFRRRAKTKDVFTKCITL
jgi:hypothetical protein